MEEAWDEMSQALKNHVWQRMYPIAIWSSKLQERALSMKMEKSHTSPVKQGLGESVQLTWRIYWHPMAITSSRKRNACHVVFKEQEHGTFLQNCWLLGLRKRQILCIISASLYLRSKTMTSHRERLYHVAVISCLTVREKFCEPSKKSYIVNPGLLFQA
jgi:hypothetical protein